MGNGIQLIFSGLVVGIGATALLDLWTIFQKKCFLPRRQIGALWVDGLLICQRVNSHIKVLQKSLQLKANASLGGLLIT